MLHQFFLNRKSPHPGKMRAFLLPFLSGSVPQGKGWQRFTIIYRYFLHTASIIYEILKKINSFFKKNVNAYIFLLS